MSGRHEVDVGELLESQPLGWFHFVTVFFCLLIVVVDGLDFGAGNVAAPAILKALKADPKEMGLVFGWMYTGILLGSFGLGWIGDKFGRRAGAIAGVLIYSVPAIATAFAGSMTELMVLRFITGLGIGGVIPNTIALTTDNSPKRYRATLTVLTFVGYAAGTAVIASISAVYIPIYGWQIVFLITGIVGTILAFILLAFLPESIRYLTLRRPDSDALRRQVRRLARHTEFPPDAVFVLRQETAAKGFTPRMLFAGNLRWTTPLLWIAYFADSFTFMSLRSWMPVLLVGAGLSQADASLSVAYGSTGGIVVLLLLARPLDRWGPVASLVSEAAAVAALLLMALPGLSGASLIALSAVVAMAGTGTHNSLNGTVGIFYPTSIRSNGVGFATGMGRFAAIIGPTLTGYLLSAKLSLNEMLYIMAVPCLFVALACIGLGRIYKQDFAPNASPAGATQVLSPAGDSS
jgi:AAHS family 4-hydroxybenzoate transporter-like MFS transporter